MFTKIVTLVIFCLFFIATNSSAANENPIDAFEHLISESVPMIEGSVKAKKTGAHVIVQFCPDNTCDIIRAPLNTKMKVLNDFAYLFFYYASGYTYLAISTNQSLPFIQSGRKLAQEIMRRNSAKCKQSDEIELASCVLNNLANENKIQLFFSRYDEGENFESEKNLIESLSVKNLRKIRKWLYKQCGNCEQKP